MMPQPLNTPDFGLPPQIVARTVADARHYLRATLGWTVSLYAVLASALAGLMSPLWLLVAVPLIYVRLALALHELLHLRTASRVPAFHRLAMIFDTPLGLGYREHRAVHLRHHRWGAGPSDPELFQIAGGHPRAFCNALIVPEYSLYLWLRSHGACASLAREAGFRLLVFIGVASINPPVFLAYWLVLRLSIGMSGFVFHHLLHQRDGQFGTFALPVSPALLSLGRKVLGDEPMLILVRHRAHHLWPHLHVRDLPDLPATFDLPAGRLSHLLRAQACQTSHQDSSR